LQNSADHFAKFCGSPRQNRPNSAVHCQSGLTFVSKLAYILSKKLQLLKAAVVLSYATNIQ